MDAVPPPQTVMRAFGVMDATPLSGGQGQSWRAGELVLKPHRSITELEWIDSLPLTRSVRTPRPIPAADGRLIVEGWSAMPYLAGTHAHRRWNDVIDAGRALSREFAGVREPEWL